MPAARRGGKALFPPLRCPPRSNPAGVGVRKSSPHAARLYSWISPPRRSRRSTWSGWGEVASRSVGRSASGGVRLSERCGRWPLSWSTKTRSTRSRWRRLRIRSQSRHSERAVRTKRSATAFAFGARTGVRMISIPSLRKTVSKSRVNLLSRSRSRKRAGVDRSASVQASWRACWVTQPPLGLSVQPARCAGCRAR